MPEETLEQTAAPQPEQEQPQQLPQAEEQPRADDTSAEENAAKEREKKKHNRVVTLLTTLILVCLVAEVALASYIGLTIYRNTLSNQLLAAQYEAYLAQQADERANPPKVQYIGPTVRVIDGVLVDASTAPQLPAGA